MARTAVLAPLAAAIALACAACGGSGGPATTTAAAPPPATTSTGKPDLAEGKTIFTTSCAGCHALADAGAVGNVGPSLDGTKLTVAELVDITANGQTGAGTMPAFVGSLTAQQIQDVAAYVASVAGK